MDEKRQIQKELFEEFVKADRKKHLKGIFQPRPKRTITLSYEHSIFIVMAFIIAAALFFSLGVERGKRLQVKSFALAEKSKVEQAQAQIAEVPRPVQEKPPTGKEETGTQPKGPAEKELLEKEPAKKESPEKGRLATLYTIQAASCAKKDSADKEVLRIKKEGFKPFVFPSGKYYIVCVGEFKNKAEAASLQNRLRKLYPDCYIRRK